MTRISDRLLVQNVDGDAVILDERTGGEIVIPRLKAWLVATAILQIALNDEPQPDASPSELATREALKGASPSFVALDEVDGVFTSAIPQAPAKPCRECTSRDGRIYHFSGCSELQF